MIDISALGREERLDLARRLLEGLTDDYGEEYRVEPYLWVEEGPTPLHFWEWIEPNRIAISELFRRSNDLWAKQILELSADMNYYSGSQWDSAFAAEGAKIGQTINIRLPNDYDPLKGTPIT